jgi:DNA-binding winged helix-turn-helix (wHTH) protein/tetratricopeptide (TPR) repeat protein
MKPVRYRFDNYLLDAAARDLWRGDRRIAIPPKSLECLAYLLQHNGRAVGRDELIAAVWGRVDASDTLLTQTIWRARRAIGDDGDDGEHSLRTVPRFGYRWVAPVRVESVAAESDVATRSSVPISVQTATEAAEASTTGSAFERAPVARDSARRWRIAGAIALAVLVAFAGFALKRNLKNTPTSVTSVPSLVVVLPVNLSDASSETTWIRLGAMEYVASRLRDAHVNVLPSERVVAIAKPVVGAAGPDEHERERLAGLTYADYLLVPHAAFADGNWRFSLDAYHDGHAKTYRAEASAPLPAANLAAARFLEDTGHSPPLAAAAPDDVNEIVQRIDAAMLEGDTAKARDLLDRTPADSRADPRLRVRAGRVAFRAGRLDEAEAAFAPLISDADVPTALRTLAEMGLGGVAIRRHRFDEAKRHYTAALTALGPEGDMNLLGRAYTERAVVEGSLGRLDLAVADVGRARSAVERSGDPLGLASLDLNGALIEHQRGHYTEAIAMFDRATDAYDRFGITDQLAIALSGKVDTQLTVLEHAGAVASSTRAWKLLPKLEDPLLIEFMATRHVQALRATGQLAEASRVLDHFGANGDHPSIDPVFGVLRAAVLVDQGKAPLALRLSDEILRDFERAPVGTCSDTVPQAALVLTDAALQSRNAAAATPLLARLSEFVASPQDPEWTFANELTSAQLMAAKGEAEADRHFAAALALADSAGEPSRKLLASSVYASYAAARSDRTRAAELLDRVKQYASVDYRAARAASLLYLALGQTADANAAAVQAQALAGERVGTP